MSNFMMNMISWILLLLVILTLYLIDKVNHLARMYEPPAPPAPPAPEPDPNADVLFAGLEGKKLWDAMNGKKVDGFDSSLVDALRPHYEPILRNHIVATFKDGLEDVGGNESRVPSSQRQISTLRGHIQSWLPPQHLGSVYRAALEFAGSYAHNPDPEVLSRLKQTVDSVVDMLYQRVSITNEAPLSETLFERPVPEEAPVAAEAQGSDAMLALTDASGQADVLQGDEAAQLERLAQGMEHVQAYEDQQRQDVAAETAAEVVPEHEAVLEAKPA
jgi:hypothetical protein